jgi:hypothetical protein
MCLIIILYKFSISINPSNSRVPGVQEARTYNIISLNAYPPSEEGKRKSRQRETPEKWERRLSLAQESKRRRKQRETPDQRERRLSHAQESKRRRKQRETPEQRERRLSLAQVNGIQHHLAHEGLLPQANYLQTYRFLESLESLSKLLTQEEPLPLPLPLLEEYDMPPLNSLALCP